MQFAKESVAMYLGWLGLIVILVGIFLPWGTYETPSYVSPQRERVVSGMTWSWGFYLQIGCVAAVAGLLSSTVKASRLTVAFLGSGGLLVILMAGYFVSSFYEQLDVYPQIQDIGTGAFITLTGGICVLLAAVLYSRQVHD
ncbi:MAG: hypothetical protein NWE77_05940 [Candidatus Bathyarchaeota archaeon]|nr:hypothetical protein [Candidatus Bathyarchaeota archaeon]